MDYISKMDDFEDALASICTDKEAIDYIVSNDKEFLRPYPELAVDYRVREL
jgi:predicted nucleic acid-binding protein